MKKIAKEKHKETKLEKLSASDAKYLSFVTNTAVTDQIEFQNQLIHHLVDIKLMSRNRFEFFVDCYTALQAKENIPIEQKVQWLADWAPFLLFEEQDTSEFDFFKDAVPKYADLTSEDFQPFFTFLKKQFDDKTLHLSLRLRFGLLIAHAYGIPLFQNYICKDFDISLRQVSQPFSFTSQSLKPEHDKDQLYEYVSWLQRVGNLKKDKHLDSCNLMADCKQLAAQFNLPSFYGNLIKAGQAFFIAAERFESDLNATKPDPIIDPKPGNRN